MVSRIPWASEKLRSQISATEESLRSRKMARYDHRMSSTIDSKNLPAFRRALLSWYRRHGRALPWRETRDPYRIWISEIMLQQTTVAAVIPYFERFLTRFPTVEKLAAAPEEDVLKLWEGLGYYSRARNIHRAAQVVSRDRHGAFPVDVGSLQSLPGIGRYTAGAIASFAYDHRAPIVEANTLRLYCRLLGYRGDPRAAAGQQRLWAFAEDVLPRSAPGEFNQALMELGARICVPGQPACDECPVRQWCTAFREGSQGEIPQRARRPEITEVTEIAVIVKRANQFLLLRCAAGERWAGLWDFVRFPWNGDSPAHDQGPKRRQEASNGSAAALGRELARISGIDAAIGERLTVIRHSVTRYRITLECYHGEWRAGMPTHESRWVEAEALSDLPLSTTGRKIARLLQQADD